MPLMSLIGTRELTKLYTRSNEDIFALKDINIDLDEGSFISVTGPSGSGKSTLLNIIGCLDRPTSGDVLIDNVNVIGLRPGELVRIRREKIGFVFQTFGLIGTMTALENVALPLYFAGIGRREREKRSEKMLAEMKLDDRIFHYPGELSGGEQQRVAIARALVNDPRLILADEPTGNLDSATGAKIISYMKKLNAEHGKTFVIATHDPDIAALADQRIELRDGRVAG